MVRMPMRFIRGPLFYLEYQWKLFRFLKKHPADIYFSNDLDTLLPNYLCCGNKEALIYDSHEFFTGVPELQQHPLKRGIWKMLEKQLLPSIKNRITVNASIASAYKNLYGGEWTVVRNIPEKKEELPLLSRKELGLPEGAFLMVLQGAGINVQRGAEEAVQSLALLPERVHLLVMGSGDVVHTLPELATHAGVAHRLLMMPRREYAQMMQITRVCDCGLSLDKPLSDNYRMSLPNKLFDYFHAGLPVVVSAVQEVKKLTEHYGAGLVLHDVTPSHLAAAVQKLLQEPALRDALAKGAAAAAKELVWGIEAEKLAAVIHQAEKKLS
jgi:glycosyltransferase involved in cell wall biosynthesis